MRGTVTTDIFIKTYPGDAAYHTHCLRSIEKFCAGFRDTVVVDTGLKRGVRSDDGRVYWGVDGRSKKEIWLTEDEFASKSQRVKEYLRQYHLRRHDKANRGDEDHVIGDTRSDGFVYLGHFSGTRTPKWVTPTLFGKIAAKKGDEIPSRNTPKHRRGDRRDDGRIFWQYIRKPNGDTREKWVAEGTYCKLIASTKRARKIAHPITDVPKRGTVRGDGLVFAGFCATRKDPMWWVTKEEYENLKRNACENHKARYLVNPVFRVSQRLRSSLHVAVKNIAASQVLCCSGGSIYTILGCNPEFFKSHLERQFSDEMNWGNYGEVWEIDHEKPCASATDENHLRQLFAYSNLRPLFKKDNQKKGCRV